MECKLLLFAAVLTALGAVNWSSSLPRSSSHVAAVFHPVSKRRIQYGVQLLHKMIANCDDSYKYCSYLVKRKGLKTTCTKWLSFCKKTCGGCRVKDCSDMLPIAVCQNARMWAVYCPMRKYREGCFKTCCNCSLTNKNCLN